MSTSKNLASVWSNYSGGKQTNKTCGYYPMDLAEMEKEGDEIKMLGC